jgi:hypothetical protein
MLILPADNKKTPREEDRGEVVAWLEENLLWLLTLPLTPD